MHKLRYTALPLIAVTISTMLLVWGSSTSSFTAISVPGEDGLFSLVNIVRAILVGAFISVLWFLYFRFLVYRPLHDLAVFTERITASGVDVDARRKLQRTYLVRLSDAIEKLADKMEADQTSFQRMERVRTEFLGNVSHELRTPIFALQGFIETLLGGAIDDPEVNRKFLERALHQTARLDSLLSDLIEISRMESGEMKLNYRYFDIHAFLQQIVNEMLPVASQRGIRLQYAFDSAPSDALILGDKKRLKQVFENLIENGLKYNIEGGSVSIRLALQSHTAIVSVIDTGIGIAEEHRTRIFERFYRVDKGRSRDVGGTGLGLAIVKHIVLAHRGRVGAAETPGGGTTFTVTLDR